MPEGLATYRCADTAAAAAACSAATPAQLQHGCARCASLALSPLPLIFSYKSEKSLCGTAGFSLAGEGWWAKPAYKVRSSLSLSLSLSLSTYLPPKFTVAGSHSSCHTNRYCVFGASEKGGG